MGAPLATLLLSLRDPAVFIPAFYVAFMLLTMYNGPLTATILDVVPPRIGTTVAGAYGMLSDRFGLDRAGERPPRPIAVSALSEK